MSALATTASLATCRNVTVVLGSGEAAVTALHDVSLSVGRGERLSLTGRSGSGKTTLLHLLGGLVSPTLGEVTLGDTSLSSLDAAARGRARLGSVAYVFQGANLLPTFTAFENVAFAAHATARARPASGSRSPEELLELVGLGAKLDSLPAELSGGEAQRVAIARALAQRPELLLCDEPTGHLDSDTAARVLDLIDALQRELDFALVVATHAPEVAARADRVITLDDGQLVHDERPQTP